MARMALAGGPIHGRFIAQRTGHALNNKLLRALFADSSAWRRVTTAAPANGWFAPMSLQAAD